MSSNEYIAMWGVIHYLRTFYHVSGISLSMESSSEGISNATGAVNLLAAQGIRSRYTNLQAPQAIHTSLKSRLLCMATVNMTFDVL